MIFQSTRRSLVLVAVFLVSGAAGKQPDMPRVHPTTIIAKYGKPDRAQSTEDDKPRPPIVTRFLDYTKEKVRFVLVADVAIGQPPPYKHWLLFAVTDPTTNKRLPPDEVIRRMAVRTKK